MASRRATYTVFLTDPVKLGDLVMAENPITGVRGPRKVVDLIRHSGPHAMVAVRLADGTEIDATDEHPFWVANRGDRGGWVDAIDLRFGDRVVTKGGGHVLVVSAGVYAEDLTAYNLTVEDLHTYYVSDADVLVHNAGGCLPGTAFDVPDSPGVYTIHLNDGSKYVGKANTSMRSRANASAGSKHALAAAGQSPSDITNITWIDLPAGNSSSFYRTVEQTVMDGLTDQGVTLLNRRNPEIYLPQGPVIP